MSLQSTFQNTTMAANATIQSTIGQIRGRISNLANSATTALSGLWDGGFVGISEAEITGTLIPAINRYCDTIMDQIRQFNAAAETSVAFRGAPEEAVTIYVQAVKELLTNYVRLMQLEASTAKRAFEQWNQGQQNVAQSARSSAQDIRAAAQDLSLD